MKDDMISRNELLEGIYDLIDGIAFTSPYQDELHCLISGMERVRDNVAEAPALTLDDLRPKGRWITQDETFTAFQCSRCECKNFGQRWNYCPACGADMQGGGEDG